MIGLARYIRCIGLPLLVGMLSATCEAVEGASQWRAECIGRYQLSFPGDVEVAVAKPETFPQVSRISPYAYSDSHGASYSKIHYEGLIFVSATLSVKEVQRIVKTNQKYTDDAKKKRLAASDKKTAESLKRLSLALPDSYAWQSGNSVELYLHRDSRLFTWEGDGDEHSEYNHALMLKILNGFRTRQLFEIPRGKGVCIPYGFIADDESSWRDVGVSFRLKDHPDVEVFFRDAAARDLPYPAVPDLSTRNELRFFWEVIYRGATKDIHLSWPPYRSVKLDQRDGEYTFARFTRTDDSHDFGYLAYVKGDPKAATDTPNLMLYVIRTGTRAKDQPVSEDELKDIAKKITASIRRRE
jgi:hypothetical protein